MVETRVDERALTGRHLRSRCFDDSHLNVKPSGGRHVDCTSALGVSALCLGQQGHLLVLLRE